MHTNGDTVRVPVNGVIGLVSIGCPPTRVVKRNTFSSVLKFTWMETTACIVCRNAKE